MINRIQPIDGREQIFPTDGGYTQRTTGSIIDNGGLNPVLPGMMIPTGDNSPSGAGTTPLGANIFTMGEFGNEDDSEDTGLMPQIAFDDNELFDGLRYSKPHRPTLRDSISEYGGKKHKSIGELISGLLFGLPNTIFRKSKKSNYGGDEGFDIYDEVFPEELSDNEFEEFLDHENHIESFLGIGKKARAKKEKRVERREARKTARADRKQARVNRKNKRVEIKQFKAETKRIGKENGDPSVLDKVITGAKSIFADQNQVNDNSGSDNSNSDGSGYDTSDPTGNGGGGYGGDIPNPNASKSKLGMFGGTTGIIIMLALIGAAIYILKSHKS
jgi:hypothetical protein